MKGIGPDAWIGALPPGTRRIVLALRAAVRRAAPGAEESVAWGALSFHRPEVGGRIRGAVCQIVVREGRVRLDFIHGARLADPAGLLRGDRVSKRFLPVDSAGDAGRPEVAALVREAASVSFP